MQAYSVVGGVPAKHIKYRFDTEMISFLLSYGWWYKPKAWLKSNSKLFQNPNKFKSKFED